MHLSPDLRVISSILELAIVQQQERSPFLTKEANPVINLLPASSDSRARWPQCSEWRVCHILILIVILLLVYIALLLTTVHLTLA